MKNLIFKFEFDYGTTFTLEEAEWMKTYLGNSFNIVNEANSNGKYEVKDRWIQYSADIEPILEKFPMIKLKINQLEDTTHYQVLTSWIAKLDNISNRLASVQSSQAMFNNKCNVHVPGLGLMQIDETTWEEDCCTERLQKMLNNGWKILAVCPQPDQRRPDYVLGRNSKNQQDY